MDLPRRVAYAGATALLSLAIAACGAAAPGQGGGGNAGDGGSPAATPAKSYTIKPGDTTPFPLAAGTYRLNWVTTGCPGGLTVILTGDNGYTNEKSSKLPNYSRILTSVPDGNYTITQTDTACTEWTVTLDKIG
jgi:hypothetical protein